MILKDTEYYWVYWKHKWCIGQYHHGTHPTMPPSWWILGELEPINLKQIGEVRGPISPETFEAKKLQPRIQLLRFNGEIIARLSKVTRVPTKKRLFSLTELSDGTFSLAYSTEVVGEWTKFLAHFKTEPEPPPDAP